MIPISISSGVAQASVDTLGFDSLLKRADQTLYQSKAVGRNHITLAM